MNFWTRLKYQIKEKNTTQEWIATKIGVPFGRFKNWLVRKTYPDLKQGLEIAELLNTSVEYLVTGNDREIFSDEEQELVWDYRILGKNNRKTALALMQTLKTLENAERHG